MTPFRLVNFSSSRPLSPGIDLSTLGQGFDLGARGPILGGGLGRPNFWKGDAF
jgi:hypothetical protein